MSRPALVALIVLGLTASLGCALPGVIASSTGGDAAQGIPAEEADEGEQAEAPPWGEDEAAAGAGRDGLKLIFIHHSSGENWLADENGGLGLGRMMHGYFVSDANYGWGPNVSDLGGPVGSFTDNGHWWTWTQGPESRAVMDALVAESEPHAS
jgi:hypothetical protein